MTPFKMSGKNQVLPEDPEVFDQSYKQAYSHGLEAIYALERVDIKTVRIIKMEEGEIKKIAPKNISQFETNTTAMQLEFDFGESFRTWVEPFFLREPVMVLGLSKKSGDYLRGIGKTTLGDLIDFDGGRMGKGYAEEIQEKLQAYVGGRSFERSALIDYRSWLISLLSNLERKKSLVCAEEFGILEIFALTPGESFELRRLDPTAREVLLKNSIEELQAFERTGTIHKDMRKIVKAFITPWMQQRYGIASQKEITERLQLVAEDPHRALKALKFFSKVYYHHEFPLNEYLYQVEAGMFCSDKENAAAFHTITSFAQTYFYKGAEAYSLTSLNRMLAEEFAKTWTYYSNDFIQAVLRKSRHFRVRKGLSGQLQISRSGQWTKGH